MNKANTSNRVTLIAECAILQLSASAASGTYRDPWDFVVRAKNSLKNRESFQNCELLVPLYNQARTHFITQSTQIVNEKS